MENKNILVIGGTGKTGARVAERLTNQGHNVRIGSRSASPSFDWQQPNTWDTALEGMKGVYITYYPDLAVPGASDDIRLLTEKAKKAGVQQLVLLSGKGEVEAQKSEQIVLNSGIDTTVVRATWFAQNFSESFFYDSIVAGYVPIPKADLGVPFVHADDIADVAVEALTKDGHTGKIYELTGSEKITFEEATQVIAKATGREIKFESISMEAYKNLLRQVQLPEEVIGLLEYLWNTVLTVENSTISYGVEEALGRKAKDFYQYVEKTAATGVWNAEQPAAV